MTFRLPLKNFRLLKLSFTIKILKKNKKWPKYSTSWLRDDLVRHSTPALFIEVYKRRDLWRAGNIWESLWCCSLPPLQGFKKGSRRAVWLWIASYNLSCVFLTSMYSEELTIGSQEWINKSDWSVFLCWLVLAVRVKNRSWSVKIYDRWLIPVRRNILWSFVCDGSWTTRMECDEGAAPLTECT